MSAALLLAAFALHGVARGDANATVKAARKPLPMPKQIVWLHVRKSGTSFVNTLLHHKDLCPDWPKDAVLEDGNAKRFWQEHRLNKLCPEGFSRTYESPPGCAGIGTTFDENAGKVMGFFRKPEQRMISEYFMQIKKDHLFYEFFGSAISPFFLQKFQGCIVKTLTRQSPFKKPFWMHPDHEGYPWEPCLEADPPTVADVKVAVDRVSKMAFVGLTSEWSLSICLFHVMYGGPCKKLEQINTRPGWKRNVTKLVKSTTTYDEFSALGFWKDPFDTPVYEEAQRVFWQTVKKWGVTEATCQRTCNEVAE